ncbi:MAG: FHA domain-containing protein [Candidatus Riflebacteria bacterium]|nr:FHA domain-containing protein [Candidatus Riflebacteria bacterium]
MSQTDDNALQADAGTARHSRAQLAYGALLGAAGGAVGWALGEPVVGLTPAGQAARLAVTLVCSAVYSAVIGGAIGTADGLKERSRETALSGCKVGAAFGLLGGLGGGWVGERIYEALAGLGFALVGRSLGWLVVGLFIGASVGAAARSFRRGLFGAIGGMLGGYIGGGTFELADLVVSSERTARLLALVLTGGFIGCLITLVEEMVKEAWLIVLNGKLEGVRFILTKASVAIGRTSRADVRLMGYDDVSRDHARIVLEGSTFWLVVGEDSSGALVNGRKATRVALADGDRIQIGKARLAFQCRTRSTAAGGDRSEAPAAGAVGPVPESRPGSSPQASPASGSPTLAKPPPPAGAGPYLETPSGPFVLRSAVVRIGSDRSNDLVLSQGDVRPFHAEIRWAKGRWVVFDVSGGAGLLVNERPTPENLVKEGFRIQVGSVKLVFRAVGT